MNVKFDGISADELNAFLAASGMSRAAVLFKNLSELADVGRCKFTVARYPSAPNSVVFSIVADQRSVFDNRHVVFAVARLPNSAFRKRAGCSIGVTEYDFSGARLPKRALSAAQSSLWSSFGRR